MKRYLAGLVSVVLMAFVTASHATVYTDLYDGQGRQVGGGYPWAEVDWLFDIGQYGFDGTREKVTKATVAFNLLDPTVDPTGDPSMALWGFEYSLAMVGNEYLDQWEVSTGTASYDLGSFESLNRSGTLEAALFGVFGEFHLDSAVLTVYAETVPEPGIVGLFAIGLILFGMAGRIRANR